VNSSLPVECVIGRRLTERRQTLATAESCSGGLVAHRITNVPGASEYFLGGVVAYGNDAKVNLLGVNPDDIADHGAVSEPVARRMAEGARSRFGADFGIGITGIAGPGGGAAGKPVGLVYIAVADGRTTVAARTVFDGPREAVKEQTAEKALFMLLERLA
jgi:nicotinamide-nucleotide amidase